MENWKDWEEETDGSLSQVDEIHSSLGILSQYTGEQARALLLIIQALARNNIISGAESRRMLSLLSPELPELQRRVTAAIVAHDKSRRSHAVRKTD